MSTVVVAPVANEKQGLFFPLALADVVQRHREGIVESRLAFRFFVQKRHLNLCEVVCKRCTEGKTRLSTIVEIHHKYLVLGITGSHEGKGGAHHGSLLGTHTSAGIHDNADRDRTLVAGKLLYGLWAAIFVDFEIASRQTFNVRPMSILYADIQHQQVSRGVQSKVLVSRSFSHRLSQDIGDREQSD